MGSGRARRLAVPGAGILLHGSGWLVDFVGYHGRAPMPSFSDPLWLGAYLGFYPGVVLLGRERFARRGVGMWLDGLLGGLALGAVTAATALQVSLWHLDAAGSATVTGAAYPLADVALLTFLATMFAGSSWRPSFSGLALVAGLFVLVGVDTTYAVDTANGGWLAGGAYDPLWGLAMLVVAAAAWLPHAAPRSSAARDAPRLPVGLRGDRGRRARLWPGHAPEPGRGRPRGPRAADRHGPHGAAAARDGHAGDLTQALAHRRSHRPGQPPLVHAEIERAVADGRRARC